MARVYVSVGSNIEPGKNIRSCLSALRRRYGELTVSSVYESEAVGFDGDNFYNLVVGFDTGDDVHAVAQALRAIEHEHGRARAERRFCARTLDLDLLLYGDAVLRENGLELPRADILRHAFVLRPLAEIAGRERHPVNQRRYAELWDAFDKTTQALWPAELPP